MCVIICCVDFEKAFNRVDWVIMLEILKNCTGMPNSLLLLSIYAEVMRIEALETIEEGILVGGQMVSDVRFVDDQGMVSSTEWGLQKLMNKLSDIAKQIHSNSNMYFKLTKTLEQNINITANAMNLRLTT